MAHPQLGCSIIIPTWNRNELLLRALRSVRRAKKSHAVEVIVIDNASYPPVQIEEFIDLNITLIRREKNSGPSIARNIGIEKSNYNIIFPLDDDDELTEDAIDIFLAHSTLLYLEKMPVVFFACSISNLKNKFEIYTFAKHIQDVYGEVKPLFNKILFLKTQLRYPSYEIGAEGLLWLQLLSNFNLPIINKIITISHQDATNRLTDLTNQLNRAAEHMNLQKESISFIDRRKFNKFYKKKILGYTCYAILAQKRQAAIFFLLEQKLSVFFLLKNISLILLPSWLFKKIFSLYRLNSKKFLRTE